MISINASYTNLVNQRVLATNTKNLHTATERLSTGAKVNHANDDAAAMFVGNSLSANISGMKIALDNTMLASNFLNIADGALNNVSANLMRMNDLATQACNGILSDNARGVLQAEMQGLIEQINTTISGATMNGTSTIKASAQSANLIDDIVVKSKTELINNENCVACTLDNLNGAYTDFYIDSVEQLQALSTYTNSVENGTVGRKFTLTADLDLSSVDNWTAIGYFTQSNFYDGARQDYTHGFQGEFDGNGHVVRNLKIDSTSNLVAGQQGLFGYALNAEIKNIGIENADVRGGKDTSSKSGDSVGALLGYADHTYITNAYSTGNVTGYKYTGGLVGTISNFATSSTVHTSNVTKCYSSCTVSGYTNTGGFAGNIYNGTIINACYATGDVNSSGEHVGGLLGQIGSGNGTRSVANNVYATGNVKGTGAVGGLFGQFDDTGESHNAYALGDIYINHAINVKVGQLGGQGGGSPTTDNYSNLYYNSNSKLYRENGGITEEAFPSPARPLCGGGSAINVETNVIKYSLSDFGNKKTLRALVKMFGIFQVQLLQ